MTRGRKKTKPVSVRIDDWKTRWDQTYPSAVIQYSDGHEESIDIIGSVRSDATAIGHPVILLAIKRWEQIVIHKAALRSPIYPGKLGKQLVRVAEKHLARLGNAMKFGAQTKASQRNDGAGILAKNLTVGVEVEYLHAAWELLSDPQVIKAPTPTVKREIISQRLAHLPGIRMSSARLSIRPSADEVRRRLTLRRTVEGVLTQPEVVSVLNPEIQTTREAAVGQNEKGSTVHYPFSKLLEKISVRDRKYIAASLGLTGFASDQLGVEQFAQSRLDIIVDFLKSGDCNPRYTRRGKFESFKSTFLVWRYGDDGRIQTASSVRSRRHRGKGATVETMDAHFLLPDFIDEYLMTDLQVLRHPPLVPARTQPAVATPQRGRGQTSSD